MTQRRSWYVRVAIGSAVLIAILSVFAIYGEVWAAPAQERFVITLLTNVILVVGLQIYIGNSGIVSFGHMAFMGIGAYAAALVSIPETLKASALPNLPSAIAGAEVGLLPSVIVGMLAAAIFAAITGLAITRLSGGAGSIASLAVLIIFFVVASNWTDVTGGVRAIYGVPRLDSIMFVFAVAAIALVVARIFRETSPGLRLRASADDPVAASTAGVNYLRLRLGAWVLSAAVVGAGGAIFAHNLTSFGPGAFYLRETFVLLAMLIIGGMGSVTGAVCGAVVVSAVNEWLRGVEDGFSLGFVDVGAQLGLAPIALAVGMLALLIYRSQGLVGATEADELPDVGRRVFGRIRSRVRRLNPGHSDG